MALFKSRNTRRSSTSYASTFTTLIFIGICVFGVWMLSSNSAVTPPSKTTAATTIATAIDNTDTTNDFSSTEDSAQTTIKNSIDSAETAAKSSGLDSAETIPKVSELDSSAETNTKTSEESPEIVTKTGDQKENPVYGDNPGHLPDDAIKPDDKKPDPDINNQQTQALKETEAQLSEESALTQTQVVEATESGSDLTLRTDKKMSESEKVAKNQDDNLDSKTSDGTESQNVNAVENNTQPKIDDEENKKQLREDKGENTGQSQENGGEQQDQQQIKQAETQQGLSSEVSQQEPQKMQDASRGGQKPKKKKKHVGADKDAKGADKDAKGAKPSKVPKKAWSTQADESHVEKKRQKDEGEETTESLQSHTWYLCNVTAGADYIPCLDNEKAIKKLRSRKHYEHRERHCPEDATTCLVPIPKGYKRPIEWPSSRDKIWYHNVPHILLAEVKGHQNWVKLSGEFLTFPGGGTQFIHGALHYIDFIQEAEPNIAWAKNTRVILDVGCGVGSFGGFLFERDVLAMSFAPKDEHEAQVQFALERGIPAISAVMGSQRLPFPSRVFDLVHCARCRVPWHAEGGLLLLELNRVLRPGGYFVWSATPVYQKLEEDVQIWNEMTSLTKAMCWELVTINKDKLNKVGAAIYRKPITNECYEQREQNSPPMCKDDNDPDAAWYVPLQACMHKAPVSKDERGAKWPEVWPARLHSTPYWLNNSQIGIYGKPASQDFVADDDRWKNVVDEMSNFGITWANVRNVMDMRAVYGGFAAALRDLPVWVFNVVNVDAPDTLPIIFERGLFGIYHDWCESFSTYPRTYDLLHADQLFSKLKTRCKLVAVMAEVDRIIRPEGKLIVRDEPSTIVEAENILKSLHWEITSNKEGILCAKKGTWRPDTYEVSS